MPDAAHDVPLLNDVHSRLNPTPVARVLKIESVDDIRRALEYARRAGLPVSVAGGRHAMGGQQFVHDGAVLDMTGYDRVIDFDRRGGRITVESGIQWPALVEYLRKSQSKPDLPGVPAWCIAQKQTGADRFTLGGSLAANIHGRGLDMRPLIGDVEAFTLVGPNGQVTWCSRRENRELFSLAIGGYGLFGVIATVVLNLVPRRKLARQVEIVTLPHLMPAFEARIREGALYGDFQFAIDPDDDGFLTRGVFSCYRPVGDDVPPTPRARTLSAQDWAHLILLAHTDKAAAFERYAHFYLATDGQVYDSDAHQMALYLDDYHDAVDKALGHAGSEVITELYVPRGALPPFLRAAARDFRAHGVDLIYGTVRLIRRDEESFLAWAREDFACVVFNLHVAHDDRSRARAAEDFRRLARLAVSNGGSFYLTYHRHADAATVREAHPRFAEFLEMKLRHDPHELFQSDWYRHYKAAFAELEADEAGDVAWVRGSCKPQVSRAYAGIASVMAPVLTR